MDTQIMAKIPKWMQIGLIVLWGVAALGVGIAFFTPQDWAAIPGGVAGGLFVVGLCWALLRIPPRMRSLPAVKPWSRPVPNYWIVLGLIIVVVVALYALGLMINPGFVLIGGMGLIALAVIIIFREELSMDQVIVGVILGVVVGFSIRFLEKNELSWALLNLNAVALTYVAGVLLMQRTRLGKIIWLDGDYLVSFKGFLLACVLAVPAASLNLVGEIYAGDTWVESWWQTFAAIGPGIGEEVWARLFLISLLYFLLRPSSSRNASRAVWASIVISAIVHSLAHTGFNFVAILFGVFFYGIPPALLYIKTDLEHAIGYHFMIDFIRFLAAALLATV